MNQNRDLFDQNVPGAFQRKLLKLVLECTRGASEHCYGTFSSPQAKDVSGVYRRGMIEDQLPA
jgi:hypothetical protein